MTPEQRGHMEAELDWLRGLLSIAVAQTPEIPGVPPSPSYIRREDVTPLLPEPPDAVALQAHREALDARAPDGLPLSALAHRLQLSALERAALLLPLVSELSPSLLPVLAYLQDDPSAQQPRLMLLSSLSGLPPADLRRFFRPGKGLLSLPGFSLLPSPTWPGWAGQQLIVSDRLICHLLGVDEPDAALAPLVLTGDIPPGAPSLVAPLASLSARWAAEASAPVAVIELDDPLAAVAVLLSGLSPRPALVVDLAGPSRLSLAERIERGCGEAMLTARVLILLATAQAPEDSPQVWSAALSVHPVPTVIVTPSRLALEGRLAARPLQTFSLSTTASDRVRWWLDGAPMLEQETAEALANAFVLSTRRIQAAATRVRAGEDARTAAQAVAAANLGPLAASIETSEDWTRLILPLRSLIHLDAIVQHQRVLISGHARRQLQVRPGISALLHGPPGTGKTLGARLIAGRLGLPLYRIDLGSIVSKYIGETEKNLSALFQTAQGSNAVLFFDEADALLGKRTTVSDAHDRHANVQTSHLLQLIEVYEGIVLLATNFRRNIDDAFIRRMDHIVEFPAPDEQERERLWQSLQPEEGRVLLDSKQCGFLARQKLTGGHIMNAIQTAHRLAWTLGQEPSFLHLVAGLRRELDNLGRAVPARAFGEHAHGLACLDQLQRWLAFLDGEVPLPVLSELSQLVMLDDAEFLPAVVAFRILQEREAADARLLLLTALVKVWRQRGVLAALSEADRAVIAQQSGQKRRAKVPEVPALEPGMSREALRSWLLHQVRGALLEDVGGV